MPLILSHLKSPLSQKTVNSILPITSAPNHRLILILSFISHIPLLSIPTGLTLKMSRSSSYPFMTTVMIQVTTLLLRLLPYPPTVLPAHILPCLLSVLSKQPDLYTHKSDYLASLSNALFIPPAPQLLLTYNIFLDHSELKPKALKWLSSLLEFASHFFSDFVFPDSLRGSCHSCSTIFFAVSSMLLLGTHSPR